MIKLIELYPHAFYDVFGFSVHSVIQCCNLLRHYLTLQESTLHVLG